MIGNVVWQVFFHFQNICKNVAESVQKIIFLKKCVPNYENIFYHQHFLITLMFGADYFLRNCAIFVSSFHNLKRNKKSVFDQWP